MSKCSKKEQINQLMGDQLIDLRHRPGLQYGLQIPEIGHVERKQYDNADADR